MGILMVRRPLTHTTLSSELKMIMSHSIVSILVDEKGSEPPKVINNKHTCFIQVCVACKKNKTYIGGWCEVFRWFNFALILFGLCAYVYVN
jgi:hypothetical protein